MAGDGMSLSFRDAPLVELVAELRWGPLPVQWPVPGPAAPPPFIEAMPYLEQFFMHMGAEVYQHGFRRAERLIPEGFPTLPFTPVYRYRRESPDNSSVFYQVGSGVFAANALPPYQSWDTFEPHVRIGLQSLLNARANSEKALPFGQLTLRYVNLFGPDLTGDRNAWEFLRDVLGFKLELPPVLSGKVAAGSHVKPHIQLSIPLSDLTLAISVGEVVTRDGPRYLMDNVVSAENIPPDLEVLMARFQAARSVIHDVFFKLTAPIHTLMSPAGIDP